MKSLRILLIILLGLTELSVAAENQALEASMLKKLKEASTAEDSLSLLLNLYDLQYYKSRRKYATQVYNLAERINRPDKQLEILRDLADIYVANDTAMRRIVNAARNFPESPEQRETLTYVRVRERSLSTSNRSIYEISASRAPEFIKELSDSTKISHENVNDRVLNMFSLVYFLRRNTPGVLMDQILNTLEHTIHELPLKLFELRSEFFKQSSMAYTTLEHDDEAVDACRHLLALLDENEKHKRANGRPYFHDNFDRYVAYRRMLANGRALTKEEATDIYRKIQALAKNDPDVAADINKNHLVDINYYATIEDWPKAVHYIRQQMEYLDNVVYRRRLMHQYLTGARAIGDPAIIADASERYIDCLEDFVKTSESERMREIQLMADLNNINDHAHELEIEKERSKASNQRAITGLVISLSVVMLFLLIILVVGYMRTKKYRQNLEKAVSELKKERANALKSQKELIVARNKAQVANRQKTEFINNMTHEVRTPLSAIADYSRLIADCVTDDKRKYLNNYVRLIEFNNELVETMVNDVLDISEIDSNRMTIHSEPTSVNPICTLAIENASHYLQPGVKIKFANADKPDVTIHTDRKRVEQVLINLLNNAAKFTKEGEIVLSYTLTGGTIEFAVTDTGSGIPEGKEELIFQRFEKLDSSTQGAGLGLPIARLIAGLLKGKVKVDTSYKGGARFIFSIPLK